MAEIEQEELDRLRAIETQYSELQASHATLQEKHNTLKDEYIELSKGQLRSSDTKKTDEFDEYCKSKFAK